MASPLTLRINDEIRQRIARIARRKGVSTSEVVREAIETFVERQETKETPQEKMADLIGVVRGGRPDRSAQTGRQLTELLKNRRSRR
jgi:predicted DNA-binding protein